MATDTDYTFTRLIKLLLSGSYSSLSALIFFQLISGICPICTSYLIAQLIDTMSINNSSIKDTYFWGLNYVTILLFACTIFVLFDEVFTVVHSFFSDYFEDTIYQKVKLILLEKISSHPNNDLFENPRMSNLISLAKDSVEDISRYVNLSSHFIKGFFFLIPAIIAVYMLEWWLPVVLLVTLTPVMYFRIKLQKHAWEVRFGCAPLFKKMDLYEKCLTLKNYSKEIRLYNMQQFLLHDWDSLFLTFFNTINRIRKNGIVLTLLLSLISGVGMGICFFYISSNVSTGKFTVGNLSFMFALLLQLRNSIASLIYSGTELMKINLAILPLLEILNIKFSPILESQIQNKHQSKNVLSLENLIFTYPGSSKPVINNITLSIKMEESIAIVGENGAGKTTLINLICRFYEPSSGKILWQGRNIATIAFEEYRNKIAGLFQDFAQFPLALRDNINPRKSKISKEQIDSILDKVNLKSLLDGKLDNVLSKTVENGMELSGGQWQRIALARLLSDLSNNKSLELLIFDEPTSALDPHAEHQIIGLIREMIKLKTSIIISHRLALTRFVDRILVMDNGRIIEDGSHEKLMKLKGKYHKMFTKQASYYKDNN